MKTRNEAIVRKIAALSALLAACLSTHAEPPRQGPVQPMSVSLQSGVAQEGDPAESPARADLLRMFKARCPGRVERLLGVALPAERPDFKVIADICACAAKSLDDTPQDLAPEAFKAQAAQAALACSKDTITTHNQARTQRMLGPYLSSQGLDSQQVIAFSQCAATTHWNNTVAPRPSPSDSDARATAWWPVCSEQVGHKGMPEPLH